MVSTEFHRFRTVFKLRKVFQGFFSLDGVLLEGLSSLKSKSWKKVITVIVRRCAKSYIFVETISGARKRWNLATVLRGASTVGEVLLQSQNFASKLLPKNSLF